MSGLTSEQQQNIQKLENICADFSIKGLYEIKNDLYLYGSVEQIDKYFRNIINEGLAKAMQLEDTVCATQLAQAALILEFVLDGATCNDSKKLGADSKDDLLNVLLGKWKEAMPNFEDVSKIAMKKREFAKQVWTNVTTKLANGRGTALRVAALASSPTATPMQSPEVAARGISRGDQGLSPTQSPESFVRGIAGSNPANPTPLKIAIAARVAIAKRERQQKDRQSGKINDETALSSQSEDVSKVAKCGFCVVL